MWKCLIAIFCAAGTVLAHYEPQSVVAHVPIRNRTGNGRPNRVIRRFTCPDGFVRLRRNCFYLSAGTANWKEAHFFCKDRNATLATLPKKYMDRQLREFLAGSQMQPLERWIGARYNSDKMDWEWGVSGDKISYDGFSKLRSGMDQVNLWSCAAMNPERKFRWAVRNCIDEKHYVCQAPVARIKCNVNKQQVCSPVAIKADKGRKRLPGRQRRRRIKALVNRNSTSTRNLIDENEILPYRQGPWRRTRKSRPMWGNGMRLGMRPPVENTRWAPGARYSDRLQLIEGTGPNDPDQWVSSSKVASMSDNHLDSEPRKESSEKIVGIPRPVPKTFSGGTENMLDQLGGMFNEEILLKN